MKSYKRIAIYILFIGIISILFGTTYAFFNYTRTGVTNTVSVGRITFVTNQVETMNLTNAFPINRNDIDTETDNVDELIIQISGDTDYSEGIEYLVSSVDTNVYSSSGKMIPIGVEVSATNLGTSNDNYFTARESTNTSIYRKLIGDTIVGNQMLLVGYIAPNTTVGTPTGINGSITIKAFFDEDYIGISDTYDGTESGNMGTTEEWANGRIILTTTEWSGLNLSFKIRIEANKGIWVNQSLEDIMRSQAVMDNVASTYVSSSSGINFRDELSDTNGKGLYMRAGTENDPNPIVYYRGQDINNNVLFANHCWKAVRTTDTGGVKLVYNGELDYLYNQPLEQSMYTNITKVDVPDEYNEFTYDSSTNSWTITVNDFTNMGMEFSVPTGSNYSVVINSSVSNGGSVGEYEIHKNGVQLTSQWLSSYYGYNSTYNIGALSSTDVIKVFINKGESNATKTVKIKMTVNSTPLIESDYTIINKSLQVSKRLTFDTDNNYWNTIIKKNYTLTFNFDLPSNQAFAFYYRLKVDDYNSSSTSASLTVEQGTDELFNDTIYSTEDNLFKSFKISNVGNNNSFTVTLEGKFRISGIMDFYIGEQSGDTLVCDNKGYDSNIKLVENGETHNSFVFNEEHHAMADAGYMYGEIILPSSGMEENAYYSTDVTYSGGVYTLGNDASQTRGGTRHYSCGANLTSCSTVRYYVGQDVSYFTLSNGDLIDVVISRSQVNTYDSVAKQKVDAWYAQNMLDYTNRLEDTIWCNARYRDTLTGSFIEQYQTNVHSYASYPYPSSLSATRSNPSFTCSSKNDSFTVNNNKGNGKLTYPVGLLTTQERSVMGYYWDDDDYYWTMSPWSSDLDDIAVNSSSNTGFFVGAEFGSTASVANGIRPAISIKPGQLVLKGTGSTVDPYVI